jgi:HEAT repeat protein
MAALEGVVEIKDAHTAAVNHLAIEELAAAGPAIVPSLLEGLKSSSVGVRLGAACVLNALGAGAKMAVKGLRTAVLDESPLVRQYALAALQGLKAEASPATDVLGALLTHPDRQVRRKAAEMLDALGAEAGVASVPLTMARDLDPDLKVRRAAQSALEKVQAGQSEEPRETEMAENVHALVQTLANGTPEEQIRAADSLGALGPEAKAAVPSLAMKLRSHDKGILAASITSLGKIGQPAAFTVPGLQAAAEDSDAVVRSVAREAVAKLKPLLLGK